MAVRLRIPKELQPAFSKLISAKNEAIEELLSVLGDAPQTFDLERLFSEVTTLSQSDASDIVSALLSLRGLREGLELQDEEFIDELLRAMDDTGRPELKLDEENRLSFKNRLLRLLSSTALNILSKALTLIYENDHTFQDARIVTDIRPIFISQPEKRPTAAVIVHLLRLAYMSDRDRKEFVIALDASDVQKLIDILERAKKKAESLKAVLDEAKISHVNAG